jgi:thiol:disulfide interchange protein DsbD
MRRWLPLLPLLLYACRTDKPAHSDNPANWAVTGVSGMLLPGTVDTVRFAAALDSGWYIYSLTQKSGGPTPMSVTIDPSPPYELVNNVTGPKPVTIFDKEFNIETERYVGTPAFAAIVHIDSMSTRKAVPLNVRVRFQACNATLCLPARTTTLTTPKQVATPQ